MKIVFARVKKDTSYYELENYFVDGKPLESFEGLLVFSDVWEMKEEGEGKVIDHILTMGSNRTVVDWNYFSCSNDQYAAFRSTIESLQKTEAMFMMQMNEAAARPMPAPPGPMLQFGDVLLALAATQGVLPNWLTNPPGKKS